LLGKRTVYHGGKSIGRFGPIYTSLGARDAIYTTTLLKWAIVICTKANQR